MSIPNSLMVVVSALFMLAHTILTANGASETIAFEFAIFLLLGAIYWEMVE